MRPENLCSKHLLIQNSIHNGLDPHLRNSNHKNGGSYRFINKDGKGNEFAFHGVYHEVTAPERIIGTFEYEGLPGKGRVSLEITTFEELPEGRTKLTAQDVFISRRPRRNAKRHGRRSHDSYDRLEELLAKMKSKH
jgi:uncharacterized protein YndB with AHSA1/START domain